ncbi:MAG: hypothetical protein R3A44_34010 [Caldilineaceae bacterium]
MDPKPTFTRLDQMLAEAPIVVGKRSVCGMASLTGWQIAAGDGSYASALGRLTPHAIRVQEGEHEYTIPISDPLPEIGRSLIMAALAVSGICLLIMFVAGRMANRS